MQSSNTALVLGVVQGLENRLMNKRAEHHVVSRPEEFTSSSRSSNPPMLEFLSGAAGPAGRSAGIEDTIAHRDHLQRTGVYRPL